MTEARRTPTPRRCARYCTVCAPRAAWLPRECENGEMPTLRRGARALWTSCGGPVGGPAFVVDVLLCLRACDVRVPSASAAQSASARHECAAVSHRQLAASPSHWWLVAGAAAVDAARRRARYWGSAVRVQDGEGRKLVVTIPSLDHHFRNPDRLEVPLNVPRVTGAQARSMTDEGARVKDKSDLRFHVRPSPSAIAANEGALKLSINNH
eukprot:scaffold19747_cov135-Isochrysis_galbana.AAC.2